VGRRRYRRAHQRRTLAIIYVVFLLVCLVCLGVFVAAVAVNALSLERPDSWGVPVLSPDSRETPGSRSP